MKSGNRLVIAIGVHLHMHVCTCIVVEVLLLTHSRRIVQIHAKYVSCSHSHYVCCPALMWETMILTFPLRKDIVPKVAVQFAFWMIVTCGKQCKFWQMRSILPEALARMSG